MTLSPHERDGALSGAVRKVSRRVVQLFVVMLICNQIDRGNISFAQKHLHADIGLSAAAFGLGAGLFFVAYAVFEIPSNLLLERFGPRIWLTRIMVTWGLVAGAMALVQGETSFYVLRFLLGVTEAGFFPAVIFYFTRWLPDSHRGRATALFIAGSSVATAITGPVSGPLLTLNGLGGLHGWQWMFAIEGALSVVVGVIAYFLLDNRVEDARWLTVDEKTALAGQIAREDAAKTADSRAHGASRWRLLASPKVLLFCWVYFAIQLAIYANTFWLPTIVGRIKGTNDVTIGLLSALPWVAAIVAMYVSGRIGDRRGNRKALLVGALLTAAAGTYLAAVVSPVPALVFLCIAAMGFKSASPLFWSFPQNGLAPAVVAPAIALINSLGNLGGFVAPYGFGLIKSSTGQVTDGLYALAVACLLGAISALAFRTRRTGDEASTAYVVRADDRAAAPEQSGGLTSETP